MSRVAKKPVELPQGVDAHLEGQVLKVKGPKGEMTLAVHKSVTVTFEGRALSFAPADSTNQANALAGTSRALANNMVNGVNKGVERSLTLVGVGYRATVQGNVINLSLGFSHPVNYTVPAGVNVAMPNNTTIVLTGCDKQKVGQIASEIRAFRPPEPYKGKGVKYTNEVVRRKETKKK